MANRAEIERALVNAHNAGDTEAARVLAGALAEQEPGLIDKAKAWAKNTFAPPSEDIPEAPYIYNSGDKASLDLYRKTTDPSAQQTQDKYGNTVWEGEKGRVYPDKPGFTFRDIPQALSRTTETLQDAAPYLAAGTATAPAGWAKAAGVQFLTGNVAGTLSDLAETGELKPSEGIKEGGLAATGEVGARVLFRGLSPIIARLFGKQAASRPLVNQNGTITDDAIKMLEEAQNAGSLDDVMQAELARLNRAGALTPDEARRFNAFIRQGIQPTRAQVTRKATDFQNQQEALKVSGVVRDAVEAQDAALAERLRRLRPQGEGGARQAVDFAQSKVASTDEAISAAYKAAREAASGEKLVKLDELWERLNTLSPDNAATNGLIASVRGEMKRNGVFPGNRISVAQAEKVRQHINRLYDTTTDYGRQISRELKGAIDDAVTEVFPDVFAGARGMKAGLESSLNRASAGRRDMRSGRGVLRDIVENRANPDNMLGYLRRESVRGSDVAELKKWLISEGGEDAWTAVKRDVVDDLLSRSFQGAEGEQGVATITRNKFEKFTKAWGKDKLKEIFTPDEMAFLDDVAELLKYREPVPMTNLGKGPSAQGMNAAIDRLIGRIPAVGSIAVEVLQKLTAVAKETQLTREVLEDLAQRTGRQITNAQAAALKESLKRALSPVGAPAAVGVSEG